MKMNNRYLLIGFLAIASWYVVAIIILLLMTFVTPVLADNCNAKYKRSCYAHWVDEDSDGEDTRVEMLIARSQIPVTWVNGKITAGLWLSQYDGTLHTKPGTLDLDHIIALGHIHRIGGATMTSAQRRAIANDPLNLELVTAGSNRQKSDHAGSRWVIPNLAWLDEFLDRQEAVRKKYSLKFEPCEPAAIKMERWVADKTSKGIRIFKAGKLADRVKALWDAGVIKAKFNAWKQCQTDLK